MIKNDNKNYCLTSFERRRVTFIRACEISLQFEIEQNRKYVQKNLHSDKEIHKLHISDWNANRHTVRNFRKKQSCNYYNGRNHSPENIFFKDKMWNGCHKKGYKEVACRLKFIEMKEDKIQVIF